ncbi:hypothetical protein FC756_19825 [Lysinibacillus mangiferihumi]|uniref:Uncharacterized protein n=1 Tax=Lysinibacillus mangiferihumi TaxID=1130819 RepID=A0A4U2YIE7_9BACI|nr:hypothetical protein [Lysinibacillus mangiferihumi]TKI60072.1 hypothetical protein FC756_19825 [Lysinibacillus mangiferihumi]
MNDITNDIVKELKKIEQQEQQKEINFAISNIKNEMNEIRNKFYSVQIVMLLIPTIVLILVESPIRFLLMHWIIQFTIGVLVITYMYRIQNKSISNFYRRLADFVE